MAKLPSKEVFQYRKNFSELILKQFFLLFLDFWWIFKKRTSWNCAKSNKRFDRFFANRRPEKIDWVCIGASGIHFFKPKFRCRPFDTDLNELFHTKIPENSTEIVLERDLETGKVTGWKEVFQDKGIDWNQKAEKWINFGQKIVFSTR